MERKRLIEERISMGKVRSTLLPAENYILSLLKIHRVDDEFTFDKGTFLTGYSNGKMFSIESWQEFTTMEIVYCQEEEYEHIIRRRFCPSPKELYKAKQKILMKEF